MTTEIIGYIIAIILCLMLLAFIDYCMKISSECSRYEDYKEEDENED